MHVGCIRISNYTLTQKGELRSGVTHQYVQQCTCRPAGMFVNISVCVYYECALSQKGEEGREEE